MRAVCLSGPPARAAPGGDAGRTGDRAAGWLTTAQSAGRPSQLFPTFGVSAVSGMKPARAVIIITDVGAAAFQHAAVASVPMRSSKFQPTSGRGGASGAPVGPPVTVTSQSEAAKMAHDHHPNRIDDAPSAGNGRLARAQWRTAGRDSEPRGAASTPGAIDRLEAEFLDGFARTSDAAGFLRLAGVPFLAEDGDGSRLTLFRVEARSTTEFAIDAGDGDDESEAGLPEKPASRRRSLALVYYDGTRLVPLTLAEARSLAQSCASLA
jgi:hypothetical protein